MKPSKNKAKNGRGREAAKADRIDEILDASARIINQQGIGEVNLQTIANQLGLKYTTLYHYFKGRDALGKATLLRSYANRMENLEMASKASGSGREQVLEFIRRELTAAPDSRATPGFIGTLAPEEQDVAYSIWNDFKEHLSDLINTGQKDGSIRPLHALTGAIAIDAILNRYIQIDAMTKRGGSSKAEVVNTIIEVFDTGILTDRQSMPETINVEEDIQDSIGWRIDPEDKDRERLELLLRTATAAFNSKGAEASIPDMSKEIGMSKTAFYQYFVDKQDLLMQCYIRTIDLLESCYRASERRYDNPVLGKLYKNLYHYQAHGSPIGPIACFNAVGTLKPQHQRLIVVRNNSARIRAHSQLRQGVDQKLFKNVDTYVVQPMMGSMSYALPYWYDPSHPLPLDHVAIQNVGLIYQGLSA